MQIVKKAGCGARAGLAHHSYEYRVVLRRVHWSEWCVATRKVAESVWAVRHRQLLHCTRLDRRQLQFHTARRPEHQYLKVAPGLRYMHVDHIFERRPAHGAVPLVNLVACFWVVKESPRTVGSHDTSLVVHGAFHGFSQGRARYGNTTSETCHAHFFF